MRQQLSNVVQNAIVVNLSPEHGNASERFILLSESPSIERVYIDGEIYDLEAFLMAQRSTNFRSLL